MIRYAIFDSSLGRALVAAGAAGLCALTLGDDDAALETSLLAKHPAARPAGGDAVFARLASAALRMLEAPDAGRDLPIDARGTTFQQKVWRALRDIPPGRTASYKEIAQRVGAPTAVRAVAGACAANPVAVAIPCHRVVRSDGALSGYRWGVARKRALLAREGARS